MFRTGFADGERVFANAESRFGDEMRIGGDDGVHRLRGGAAGLPATPQAGGGANTPGADIERSNVAPPIITSDSHDSLWDVEAVARRLGVQVRHIRRLVAERRIPFIKWGHLLRFDPAEVEAWLDAARRPPEVP